MLPRRYHFFLEIASASLILDLRRHDSILRKGQVKARLCIIHAHTSIIHIFFQSPSASIAFYQSVITGPGVAHAILLEPSRTKSERS